MRYADGRGGDADNIDVKHYEEKIANQYNFTANCSNILTAQARGNRDYDEDYFRRAGMILRKKTIRLDANELIYDLAAQSSRVDYAERCGQ